MNNEETLKNGLLWLLQKFVNENSTKATMKIACKDLAFTFKIEITNIEKLKEETNEEKKN